MKTNRSIAALLFVATGVFAAGCPSPVNPDGGSGDTGTPQDVQNPPGFIATTQCPNASDYVTTPTTVSFGVSGNRYTPNCLKVTPGTSVTFQGDFAGHPLAPGSDPVNANNPIQIVNTGATTTVAFPTAGTYSYFCQFHGAAGGTGMAGVVWVVQ